VVGMLGHLVQTATLTEPWPSPTDDRREKFLCSSQGRPCGRPPAAAVLGPATTRGSLDAGPTVTPCALVALGGSTWLGSKVLLEWPM
jgi:hypothetical protein